MEIEALWKVLMHQNPGRFSSVILHAPIIMKALWCCRDSLNPYYAKRELNSWMILCFRICRLGGLLFSCSPNALSDSRFCLRADLCWREQLCCHTHGKKTTWPWIIVTWKLRGFQLVVGGGFWMLFWNTSAECVCVSPVTAKALLSKVDAAASCGVKNIDASRERALGEHVGYLSGWTRLSWDKSWSFSSSLD